MTPQAKPNLSNKIFKEIREEEGEIEDDLIEHSINNAKDNIDSLGLACNLEGIKFPRRGKQNKKRGRKMLVELRTTIGKTKNQKKIYEILKAGKGKHLPTEK